MYYYYYYCCVLSAVNPGLLKNWSGIEQCNYVIACITSWIYSLFPVLLRSCSTKDKLIRASEWSLQKGILINVFLNFCYFFTFLTVYSLTDPFPSYHPLSCCVRCCVIQNSNDCLCLYWPRSVTPAWPRSPWTAPVLPACRSATVDESQMQG